MASHRPGGENRSLAKTGHSVESSERRHSPRISTARLVRIAHDGCTSFARCRDISDTGVKLSLLEPIEPGELVLVSFSSRVALRGQVVWVEGAECGIAFDREVDSLALLSSTALEARGESDGRTQRRGDGPRCAARGEQYRFRPGLSVVMMLESGREERAVLDWTMDGFAGLLLEQGAADPQIQIIEG